MLILGVNAAYHDTAAVVIRDGEVVAAVEEERLNRVKHTNAFPAHAIRACLQLAGASLDDVDRIAYNHAEEDFVRVIARLASSQRWPQALTPRSYVAHLFATAGVNIDAAKVRFVPHHVSHAASALLFSGFDDALVLSIDGAGEDCERDHASGIVCHGRGRTLVRLRTMAIEESLGLLYGQVTKFLGFEEFDEYKVMGLASYGNRETYGHVFDEFYSLTDDGWYQIDRLGLAKALEALLHVVMPADGCARLQPRSDIAAACQQMLERIVLHVVQHFASVVGSRRLALAGGVALNCALVGRLHRCGAFDDVFVQPASYDAGGALGAAAYVAAEDDECGVARDRLRSVSWGTGVPDAPEIERVLGRWRSFVTWELRGDIVAATARVLAQGSVVGWVQGRSEFGPRALGNRSILADPRSRRQRDIVNRMIKKREDFRPFAPSVVEEKAREYFEMPASDGSQPFMVSLVRVHENERTRLEAVTHVDGTARIQTVDRSSNPRYWDLINAFGDLTGVYVLLNTSFNNSAEPIVDSIDDALTTYLSTELDVLVIGDYWIRKAPRSEDWLMDLAPRPAPSAQFRMMCTDTGMNTSGAYRWETALASRPPISISSCTLGVLARADGTTSLRALVAEHPDSAATVLADVQKLWWHRLVQLSPLSDE